MVRPRSLPTGYMDRFLTFIKGQNVEDNIFKRDELRRLYDTLFKPTLDRKCAFSLMMKSLTASSDAHELGDFYIFGKDVQPLYERIINDSDFMKKLDEWKTIAEENPLFCETCGIECTSEKSLEEHQLGYRHRIHKLHVDIYLQSDMMTSTPPGLRLTSDPAVAKDGTIERECKPGQECKMSINIENTLDGVDVVFQRHVFLWDTGVFNMYKVTDRNGRGHAREAKNLHIKRGEVRIFQIVCKAPKDFGYHFVPLALYFVKKDSYTREIIQKEEMGAWTQDFVLRFVSLHVIGDMHEELAPTYEFNRLEKHREAPFDVTVAGEPLPEPVRNGLAGKLQPFSMPPHLYGYVKKGITLEDGKWVIHSSYLSKILDRLTSPENYRSKFHYLLWIEEMQMRTDIHQYDLNGVTMDLVQNTGKMKLEVPGLAENRPSVLRGDHLYIYICCDGGKVNNKAAGEKLLVKVSNLGFELKCEGEDSEDRDVERDKRVRYEGIVHKTELHHVQLGVARKLQNSWMEGKRYNVEFSISPFNMWVQHRAVENSIPFMDLLFPEKHDVDHKNPDIVLRPFFDKKLNSEQQTAVRNIVQGTSRPAPYIIFGPPGTGKTVTITEAIKQVYDGQKDSRILVCCPENTAADFLMRKLLKTGPVMKKDIFRMFAMSRAYETVHPDIWDSDQHNYDHENTYFYYPTVDSLKHYRILVVTLMTSGRMVTGKFPKNHFTHIFIDEGGHAVEPECIVPITGLMDPTDKSGRAQLVIAGDPQQLGPIIRSPISLNFGLAISLMERLMTDIEMYKTQPRDERYITKLIRNYRSHDSILEIPRRLFYNNELKACGDPVILNSMLDWEMLPNKKFPIIFHAVFGTNEQEGNSPSWFNRDEIAQIDKYLISLLKEKKGRKLKPSDIGIISPYRKQVAKIRQMLTAKRHVLNSNEITVGSVEEFQGQEFTVIIISAVRSSRSTAYTDMDITFNLGFLRNHKRFNVAVTRARSLLIVIGNPITLEQDPNWKAFIDNCDLNNAFKGQKGKLKSDHGLQANRETTIYTRGEVVDDLPSLVTQTEDPVWERRE